MCSDLDLILDLSFRQGMSSSLISFSDPSSQTDLLLRMVEQMVGFIDEEIAAGNWVTEEAVMMWYMDQVGAELQTEAEANTRQALAQSMIEQMIHEKTVVVKEESPDPAVPELRKLERAPSLGAEGGTSSGRVLSRAALSVPVGIGRRRRKSARSQVDPRNPVPAGNPVEGVEDSSQDVAI